MISIKYFVFSKLRKADFLDALEHLSSIRRNFAEHFNNKVDNEGYEPNISLARLSFSQITGKEALLKYSDIHRMLEDDKVLFYCLVQDSLAPVSIIHGYSGYKTEYGLRKVFIDIVEEKLNVSGTGITLGVPSIPSLVVSDCLIKANGMPFMVNTGNKDWVSVFSMRHNPIKVILELIWTKIAYYFDVEMPWNDGLDMESVAPLMKAKVVQIDKQIGWRYDTLEYNEKALIREDNNSWSPHYLGIAEMSALNRMIIKGGFLPLDSELNNYLEKYNTTVDEVIHNLIITNLFIHDDNSIYPLKKQTYIINIDDGCGYISDERERLVLWCSQNEIPTNFTVLIFLE